MKILPFFFVGFSLIACTEISYKEPQPVKIKALSQIPATLQGKYLVDGKDTVYLFDKGMRGRDRGKEEVVYLSDTIVLKEYKDNYFVSYRDGSVWLLRILKQDKNGDIYLLEMDNVPEDEVARNVFIEKLSKETPVAKNGSHYIIEPSARKLNNLVKKGFFKGQEKIWLKKIN